MIFLKKNVNYDHRVHVHHRSESGRDLGMKKQLSCFPVLCAPVAISGMTNIVDKSILCLLFSNNQGY